MTAVLSPIDALRRDPMSSAMDDSAISYSGSTDWRAKYDEVADMLAETRAELDDFHHASKELEAELEAELQRTEKTQQDLRVKVARAETERDDWKSKFISLQTTHNTITASLQRELDRLRQEHQVVKVQLRELEMGNDDLERTERAVSSTLADVEAKYSRALEEKILLEHELLDKANVEEQCQRLRDELRDSNAEISHLKDQLAARSSASSSSDSSHSSGPLFPRMSAPSTEDLLSTPAPPDLQLAELDPSTDNLPDTNSSEDEATPRKAAPLHKGQSTLLQRAGFQPAHSSSMSTPPSGSSIPRSRTIPSYSSPRTPTSPSKRPAVARNPSTMSTNSTTSTASKSRGVQMVTEMRARVKNLEQKIHTRVPRLRMGSMSGRQNANALAASSLGSPTPPSGSRSVLSRTSWENPLSNRRSSDSKRSTDTESEKSKKGSAGDTSGWVLIMEDSPSPPKERRRGSSPKRTFRPAASTSSSPTFGSSKASPLFQSTINTGNTNIKRPQSRLSGGSTATTTSIPTPTSRPATPTFLPLPTGTTGMIGQKRSTGPGGATPYAYLGKRSSLGSSTAMAPPGFTGIRSGSSNPSDGGKALPQIPGAHANITMRSHGAKLPSSNSTNLLGQSRIGRPSGGRRKSAEGSPELKPELTRPRSGSVAAQRKSNS